MLSDNNGFVKEYICRILAWFWNQADKKSDFKYLYAYLASFKEEFWLLAKKDDKKAYNK